jgi:endonuclease/exonuclease/phosphatase family metal-dependent hydrolase
MGLWRTVVRLSGFAFFLAAFSCQKSSDNPPPFAGPYPDTISVMEYNVENLFDVVDNGTEYPEYKPGACNWTFETFHVKLENIADVIAAANPDIAVLVEIENENAARALAQALKTKNRSYPYMAFGDMPNRTITIPCIMSKFPIPNYKGFAMPRCGANGFYRNLLKADVCLGRDTLIIFACHWPSKKEPESLRLEEALMLKEKLAGIPSGKDYLIAGDLNENYDECASFRTQGLDDTHGKTGINHVLRTVQSPKGVYTDYVAKNHILSLGGLPHFDPWLDIAEDRRMSEIYRGQKNTPDHILLPAALFDTAGLSYVDRSFRVFSWDGRLLLNGAPYRWQMRFENHVKLHRGEGYSDHLPIMLNLCKGPFHPETPQPADAAGGHPIAGKSGGFESGVEGWVSGASHITCSRDTVGVRYGKYCLKISGFAGKQNVCAAKALLQCAGFADTGKSTLSLAVRGRGSLSFRARAAKTKKWTYYNGTRFDSAKSAQYTLYNFIQWVTIRLALPAHAREVEFEIRIKKQTAVDLQIDNIVVFKASLAVK